MLLLVLMGTGCSDPATPTIDGKWKIVSAMGDGREMSAPGDQFDFQPDGKAVVRMAGQEEKGNWSMQPETNTLLVKNDEGLDNNYDCRFSGDSLFLKTVIGVMHRLEFVCVRMK